MQDGRGESGPEALGRELAPGTAVAGFVIEGWLAAGSSGGLYRARRGTRRFALKLVPHDERGEREVDALRRVRALPVVGFHGYGLWPDEAPRLLVLALELVEGQELDAWARDFNPSARELLVRVLLPLVDILGQVHAAGVVHRDVKEANIVIRHADSQPVLVDFGAAACVGAPRLTQRLPPGTPEYRSPEMLRFAREWGGEPPPECAGDDLWALGVTLYALLTRTLPFGDRRGALVRTILEVEPAPAHERNPRVPVALGQVCLRLLHKTPGSRYADAAALAQALREALAGADDTWDTRLFTGERRLARPEPEPTPAPGPPSPWRRRVALGVCALLALGLAPASRWLTSEVDPATQPLELTSPLPTRQGISRQELAPERMTGEVGFNAGPQKSPSPAPVADATHPSEPAMPAVSKSKTQLGLTLATTACLSAACVTAPQPASTLTPCPKGAQASMDLLGWSREGRRDGQLLHEKSGRITQRTPFQTRNGRIYARLLDNWGKVRHDTLITGEMILANGYVMGRFYELDFENGTTVPVCLEFRETMSINYRNNGGASPTRPIMGTPIRVYVKERFNLEDPLPNF
jgi:serine/threonine protein kinase